MRRLRVYSGRNRPDLTPVYERFQSETGIETTVEMVYHHDVERRIASERDDPKTDVLLTNSQLAPELARPQGIFEPYESPVARAYDPWLRAEDFSWLSFTAWPRVAMVHTGVLPDREAWPTALDDLRDPRFRDQVACAALVETTTVAQFAALRVVRGDAYVIALIDALFANGMRVYPSNLRTREALVREPRAVALANASNVYVFADDGQPVTEAWLDQGPGGMGTHVEAHTVALVRGAPNPAEARAFIDHLLSPDTQTFLARTFGETPVNPRADHGTVRPLSTITRLDASLAQVAALVESTVALLKASGFDVKERAA
ncbi:MAG: extracellular solute-binding protein [Chloroflexi bacterium]|nr:extracellular solute-binding protein [Chloroflexota bacterium]